MNQRFNKFQIDESPIRILRRCVRCILPETMPFIEFDEEGVCNYCRAYKKHELKGTALLAQWAENIRSTKKQPNCIVSFSGGRDSSYGLHYFVKELGLSPIAYSYDWGMVTELAQRNQRLMCEKLGVELIVVSANIRKKRAYIHKNLGAWLKKPDLGMVPLFMAGDKQFFYYANKTMGQYGLNDILMASNPYEITHFKAGFCGVKPDILRGATEQSSVIEKIPAASILRMTGHYIKQYITNPRYINSSLFDTAQAAASYYVIPHNYMRLYDYIPWEENTVNETLLNEYHWETATDTKSTWRIGDGVAPFYNYIYYVVAGFTENDTLRSNQIREGMLTRDEALKLVYMDNAPRFESLQWFFDAINMDMDSVLSRVNQIPKWYNI